MPTIEKIIEELQWLSDRISTQVRTIAVSLILITWGFVISEPEIAYPITNKLKKQLLIVGVIALIAMVSDFLQYFSGYLNTNRLLSKMESNKLVQSEYDYSSKSYKFRTFFFWFKQAILFIACIWFFLVIIPFCIKAVISAST